MLNILLVRLFFKLLKFQSQTMTFMLMPMQCLTLFSLFCKCSRYQLLLHALCPMPLKYLQVRICPDIDYPKKQGTIEDEF